MTRWLTARLLTNITYLICHKCGDELGRIVSDHILGAHSDLHATDARYHCKCNASFQLGTHRTSDADRKCVSDDKAFSETANAAGSNLRLVDDDQNYHMDECVWKVGKPIMEDQGRKAQFQILKQTY